MLRDAVVWSGPVQRPFSLNPELDPGPVQALWLNCEPLWGLVQSSLVQGIFHAEPQTGP
jgi:hypothetical protein